MAAADELELAEFDPDDETRDLVVRVHAAAFYVACLKAGFLEEATEFADWYLDTFDHDLES